MRTVWRFRAALVSLVAVATLVSAAPASADDGSTSTGGPDGAPSPSAPLTPVVELRHDVVYDGVATALLAGVLVTWRATRADVLPSSCVICDGTTPGKSNGLDDAFRDAFSRRDGQPAKTASEIVAYGVGPAMGLTLTYAAAAVDHRAGEAPLNGLLVLEASLAGIAVNEAVGAFFRRERPRVHALEGDAKTDALGDASALESFPSGQTAAIMAITASTATVASQRGYRLAPLVWLLGTTLGLTSTYLGIAADESHLTDHLAGAVIGLGVGAAIPLLFHHRRDETPSLASRWLQNARISTSPLPGGRAFGCGWTF